MASHSLRDFFVAMIMAPKGSSCSMVHKTAHELEELNRRIIRCRACPRLVRYREAVARRKVARFRDWEYWGRPLPGFGDPNARLLVVGLAPAAHGGNRTGRMFTGDRSGDWLFRALFRAGFANQPTSVSKDDGLALRDCYITAAIRCAPPENKPTRVELARCQPYLEEEIRALKRVRYVVTLGQLAMKVFLRAWQGTGHALPRPTPTFRHGARWTLDTLVMIASYHPSQRNTSTGLLTEPMFDSIFESVREGLGRPPESKPFGCRPANERPAILGAWTPGPLVPTPQEPHNGDRRDPGEGGQAEGD